LTVGGVHQSECRPTDLARRVGKGLLDSRHKTVFCGRAVVDGDNEKTLLIAKDTESWAGYALSNIGGGARCQSGGCSDEAERRRRWVSSCSSNKMHRFLERFSLQQLFTEGDGEEGPGETGRNTTLQSIIASQTTLIEELSAAYILL